MQQAATEKLKSFSAGEMRRVRRHTLWPQNSKGGQVTAFILAKKYFGSVNPVGMTKEPTLLHQRMSVLYAPVWKAIERSLACAAQGNEAAQND